MHRKGTHECCLAVHSVHEEHASTAQNRNGNGCGYPQPGRLCTLFFQSRQWDDAFRWQRTHRFIALIDRLQWDTLQSKRSQDPLHFLIRHELHAPFLADKQPSYLMNSNRFAALHCRLQHRCLGFYCPQGLVQRKARLLGNGLDQNTVMVNDSFVEQDGSRGWNQLLTLVVIPRRFSVANKSAQSRNNDAIVVQKQAVEVVIKEVHGVTVRAYAPSNVGETIGSCKARQPIPTAEDWISAPAIPCRTSI